MQFAVRIRSAQMLIGVGYVLLTAIALARNFSGAQATVSLLMAVGAFMTGRACYDGFLSLDEVPRVFHIGLALLLIGLILDIVGDTKSLMWVEIALPFCAGNRLKAAGLRLWR